MFHIQAENYQNKKFYSGATLALKKIVFPDIISIPIKPIHSLRVKHLSKAIHEKSSFKVIQLLVIVSLSDFAMNDLTNTENKPINLMWSANV